jgi:hypothetical protein
MANDMSNKATKRAAKLARAKSNTELPQGLKLTRFTICTKPGKDGCVNTEGSEHENAGWVHWCPGCKNYHMIAVEHPFSNGAKWTFDGNMHAPTFAPSVKMQYTLPTVPKGRPDAGKQYCCHYFIRRGYIQFCNDCTHGLRSQTVPLPLHPKGDTP